VQAVDVTPLGSAADVLDATGPDPFTRSSLRTDQVRGWAVDGATAWLGADLEDGTARLSTLGAPVRIAALLAELLPDLPPGQRVTVPRGTPGHLPTRIRLRGTDWDLRWCDAPPALQPGEERVGPVEDESAIAALLAASSPTAAAQPGKPAVRRWVGIRDRDGQLLACAADTSGVTGVGHLSSVAVRLQARGQGFGKAVTAALTRLLMEEGNDLVTLGIYADNASGRALYDALGFADEHRMTSGPLRMRSGQRTEREPERVVAGRGDDPPRLRR
jgi:ribosomal protein S18 acetylase RimI-like enzyme